MIIAFMNMKSGWVPFIEGLCALIYFRFEISVVWCSHLLLFFVGRSNTMLKKRKSCSKISSRLRVLAYTYRCFLCSHIRIHICRDLVHPDSSGPPGVSSRPTGSHPGIPCVVCVRIHTHTPTYTPSCVKNCEDTDNTPISPSFKNNPPRQATNVLID